MPYDPLKAVAEILGEPADQMRNPANAEYQCPFINNTCTKTSHDIAGPLPVCTVYRGKTPAAICVCPNRFYEADIAADVIAHAWAGPPPANPRVVHEVQMEKFGKVDFVLADMEPHGRTIRKFVSVELQAVDITGSYLPAYTAVTNNQMMPKGPKFGINWANVRKRFVSQLIAKGFYHHHWDTRIVAVLQSNMFDKLQAHARVPEVALDESNIVFMLYQYAPKQGGGMTFRFDRAVPTTHVNVMNAVIYERPPSKAEFERRILARLAEQGGP